MYTDEDTQKGANDAFLDVPEPFATTIRTRANTVGGSNILKLYSPHVSTFKIEITRPYFANFADLATTINYDTSTDSSNYASLLGLDSFSVIDKDISPDGSSISVDTSRVRILIDDDTSPAYTVDALKSQLYQLSSGTHTLELSLYFLLISQITLVLMQYLWLD